MELRFSRNNLLNTVLRDADGKPLYRISTHKGSTGETSVISRFVSREGQYLDKDDAEEVQVARSHDDADETDIHLLRLEEQETARIEWHFRRQTVFKFAGRSVKVGDYMPGKGFFRRYIAFVSHRHNAAIR